MSDFRGTRRSQPKPNRRRPEAASPTVPGSAPGRGAPAKRETPPQPARGSSDVGSWLYGRHAVAAALANPKRRWRRLAVLAGQEAEARALVAVARAARRGTGEAVQVLDSNALAAILPSAAVHQGLALGVEPLAAPDLDDVLHDADEAGDRCVAIVLDRPKDPQNVGAVLRSAAAFGALTVIVPERGAAPVTGALAKAASGAVETVPLVRVVNLARALDRLKQAGFWICGLDVTARLTLAELELGERVAIVLGSEGDGMRRLVRERCDFVARLPTRAAQPSLNVSNAAAVALYELVRSRGTGS